jgi:hypothetical protein
VDACRNKIETSKSISKIEIEHTTITLISHHSPLWNGTWWICVPRIQEESEHRNAQPGPIVFVANKHINLRAFALPWIRTYESTKSWWTKREIQRWNPVPQWHPENTWAEISAPIVNLIEFAATKREALEIQWPNVKVRNHIISTSGGSAWVVRCVCAISSRNGDAYKSPDRCARYTNRTGLLEGIDLSNNNHRRCLNFQNVNVIT